MTDHAKTIRPIHQFLRAHSRPTKDTGLDLVLFKLEILGEPNAEEFKALLKAHPGVDGEFDIDIKDGEEYSYFEIGDWIGDRLAALALMGMGAHLGLWDLVTPHQILADVEVKVLQLLGGEAIDKSEDDLVVQLLARMGMILVKAKPAAPEAASQPATMQ